MNDRLDVYEISTHISIDGRDSICVGSPLYRIANDNIRDSLPNSYDGDISGLEYYLERHMGIINGISVSAMTFGYAKLTLTSDYWAGQIKHRCTDNTRVQVWVSYRKVGITLMELVSTFPVEQSMKYLKQLWKEDDFE